MDRAPSVYTSLVGADISQVDRVVVGRVAMVAGVRHCVAITRGLTTRTGVLIGRGFFRGVLNYQGGCTLGVVSHAGRRLGRSVRAAPRSLVGLDGLLGRLG